MAIDLGSDFVLQTRRDIIRRHGTESLPGLAGLEGKDHLRFADAARDLFRFVQFLRFTLGAFRFQHVELAHAGLCDLKGFALGEEEITRKAPAHFDDIGFGAEPGDIFREDDLSRRHGRVEKNSTLRSATRVWIIRASDRLSTRAKNRSVSRSLPNNEIFCCGRRRPRRSGLAGLGRSRSILGAPGNS